MKDIYITESVVSITTKVTRTNIITNYKGYKVKSPSGVVVTVKNMNALCRSLGLDQGCMSKVAKGKLHQHKGWTKA